MGEHPKGYCPVFGNYPKEYNRAVHGPYYPWKNYGPQDTPFYDVKLGEMKSWLARRNKTPQAITSALSRTIWYWHWKWADTRYGAFSKPVFQMFVCCSFVSMLLIYNKVLRPHRTHKYHW